MTPDPWAHIVASEAPAKTRAGEPCPCAEILAASAMIAVAALSASMRGDEAASARLMEESEELQAILENHAKGLVSSGALLDWKHAREEQAGAAS